MTNLLVQSFGKEYEYRRAVLTILSFYAYNTSAKDETTVLLFTDNPAWFAAFFQGLPVHYINLKPEKIKFMRGQIDFLHHMKIAMIEEAFESTEGILAYADSDTFFIADPQPLLRQLSPGKSFMHLLEYKFEELRNMKLPAGKTFHDFLTLIENNSFKLANGCDIKVDPRQTSWNAGVMFFHPSQASFIPDVYALTEQFYPSTQNHASEQYAFSIVLQIDTKINPCNDVIYHYWYRVKKNVIDFFLKKELNREWASLPLQTKLEKVSNWTKDLPCLLETHEWILQDNAIQAFNENKYIIGYKWAIRALLKSPFNSGSFFKDILYHSRRLILNR